MVGTEFILEEAEGNTSSTAMAWEGREALQAGDPLHIPAPLLENLG